MIVKGADGRMHKTTFQDAAVCLPIVSINEVARSQHRIWFEEGCGAVVHKPSRREMPFIARSGVYFIKMLVPRALMKPEDFQRPGRA